MQFLFGAFVCFLVSVTALPQSQKRSFGPPTVSLSYANVIGSSSTVVDSFKGIPYAQPPVGNLRLKPPQPITANLGTINAVGVPKACPQFLIGLNTSLLPLDVVGYVLNTPLLQTVTDSGEDCLTINVQRPSNLPAGTKLPVVFWMFGGGFEFGSTQIYDGSQFVLNSISKGTPVIFVSVNYRVGGFGFMPGKEILADGSSNLGLLDQRLGLQWVADNIAAFGGDPDKVTIWGESAGSISVLDQMVLYNGDNTYKGKPLFRGAIMDSGSVVPANPVDCAKGQAVYDTVVRNAGCSNSLDTLACLRFVSYETLLNASNSVPGIFSYNSLALSYLPRPDGKVLTDSPDTLIFNGLYAKVPFIVGDQKDEGTLFALTQGNILTNAQLTEYLQTLYFPTAPASTISGLVNVYPDSIAEGSPFDTGILNSVYPKFKKLAAMLGDLTFTLTRRRFLSGTTALAPSVPSWSYLASYGAGFPILGTFHATDILPAFGFTLGFPQQSIQGYYIAFINSLNPNTGSKLTNWPQWSTAQQLMNFQALQNVVIQDNFRSAQYQFIVDHETDLFI